MKASRSQAPLRVVHQKALICLTISLVLLLFSTRIYIQVPGFLSGYVIGGVEKAFAEIGSFFSNTIGAISELRTMQKEYDKL